MAYSECLPTRLNLLAERTCFSQVPAGLDWFSMDVYKFRLPNRSADAAAWTLTEEVYTTHICAPRPQDRILCMLFASSDTHLLAPGSP